eukprot:TRINITY_DN11653_c0_g1_i1.p1 TRINITY_DN11653_c0_g1~~TRINITY_DN11653_c0_g1_i1.p1  ORF type:complete len:120 (+),score=28.47 TRINITY_DN11653_c0_g1_i1:198-557(+)
MVQDTCCVQGVCGLPLGAASHSSPSLSLSLSLSLSVSLSFFLSCLTPPVETHIDDPLAGDSLTEVFAHTGTILSLCSRLEVIIRKPPRVCLSLSLSLSLSLCLSLFLSLLFNTSSGNTY